MSIGELIGAGAGLIANSMDNKASAKAAAKANDFTQLMMQKRHQWEVDDLRDAGLNPILSANAAPSMGSSAKADVHSSSEAISRGVSSALSAKLIKSQIQNLQSQSVNQEAQSKAALASANLNNVTAGLDTQYRPWESGSRTAASILSSAGSAARGAQAGIRALKTAPKTYFGAAGQIIKSIKGVKK